MLRKGGSYYAVDTWAGGKNLPKDLSPEDRLARFKANVARNVPDPFVEAIWMPSLEAAATFGDDSVDLVYLDADHRYEAVRADIAAWWPKVKPGGLLMGHDYGPGSPGVMRAVEERFRDGRVYGFELSAGRWRVWKVRKA